MQDFMKHSKHNNRIPRVHDSPAHTDIVNCASKLMITSIFSGITHNQNTRRRERTIPNFTASHIWWHIDSDSANICEAVEKWLSARLTNQALISVVNPLSATALEKIRKKWEYLGIIQGNIPWIFIELWREVEPSIESQKRRLQEFNDWQFRWDIRFTFPLNIRTPFLPSSYGFRYQLPFGVPKITILKCGGYWFHHHHPN